MLHANISSPDVCWRIPNTNWRAHLELCHRYPDTLKGPDTMLNQSRYPPQLWGNAHLCKLKTARTVESFNHREKLSLLSDELLLFWLLINYSFLLLIFWAGCTDTWMDRQTHGWTDGHTDARKKWCIEVGAPSKNKNLVKWDFERKDYEEWICGENTLKQSSTKYFEIYLRPIFLCITKI